MPLWPPPRLGGFIPVTDSMLHRPDSADWLHRNLNDRFGLATVLARHPLYSYLNSVIKETLRLYPRMIGIFAKEAKGAGA